MATDTVTRLQAQHARELEYLHQKIEDLGLLLWEWRVLGEKIARDGLTAGTEPALRDLIGEKP